MPQANRAGAEPEVALARPLSYPPIERLGVIGDRRTAALVAPDGTIGWLCLPDYDGEPAFAALVDAAEGGHCRFGPAMALEGRQHYDGHTPILVTRWAQADWDLELTDAMPWPERDRDPARRDRRVILRRLRCRRGRVPVALDLRPRSNAPRPGAWASFAVNAHGDRLEAAFDLSAGEEAWLVLGPGEMSEGWSVESARAALDASAAYWRHWSGGLTWFGPRRQRVLRSALTFHLLSYAPSGALVAAPTSSLPEVIGGTRNYDYRFAWVRDASLSLAILAVLGDVETARSYMDWLAGLDSSTDMPLQVLYRISGATDVSEREADGFEGYRGSRPVRFGNHAFRQHQIDSLGYLADCALIYLRQGGPWRAEYGAMICRLADYTAAHWRQPDSGIWELDQPRHYVSSKVMSWVVLDRAVEIARRTGLGADTAAWREAMEAIRADVMTHGWSEERQSFRQHYDAEDLDASALLIPIMRFLPPDHPRVRATIDRIAETLSLEGFVWRFATREGKPPSEEGAFLPCTFWLAASYAMAGEPERAEEILSRVEALSGKLGLLAEEADPIGRRFLGNTPLLFAHAEYLKAVMEIAKARLPSRLLMMLGLYIGRLRRHFGRRKP